MKGFKRERERERKKDHRSEPAETMFHFNNLEDRNIAKRPPLSCTCFGEDIRRKFMLFI